MGGRRPRGQSFLRNRKSLPASLVVDKQKNASFVAQVYEAPDDKSSTQQNCFSDTASLVSFPKGKNAFEHILEGWLFYRESSRTINWDKVWVKLSTVGITIFENSVVRLTTSEPYNLRTLVPTFSQPHKSHCLTTSPRIYMS